MLRSQLRAFIKCSVLTILFSLISFQDTSAQLEDSRQSNEEETKEEFDLQNAGITFIEKQSLQNRLVKFYLKIRGEKKFWESENIGEFLERKRKKDDFVPKSDKYKKCEHEICDIAESNVSILTPENACDDELVIYIPGGAFILGPMKLQWALASRIAKETEQTVWVVDYPKAPEYDLAEIYESNYQVYKKALKKYPADKITLIGGSSGGNICLSLALKLRNEKEPQPKQLVLFSPFIDFTSRNPEVETLVDVDPILATPALMTIGDWLKVDKVNANPEISPLYNNLKNLPPMFMFIASDDILMPDQKLFYQKALEDGAEIEAFYGHKMIHDWPVLPTKEGRLAINQVINILNKEKIEQAEQISISED